MPDPPNGHTVNGYLVPSFDGDYLYTLHALPPALQWPVVGQVSWGCLPLPGSHAGLAGLPGQISVKWNLCTHQCNLENMHFVFQFCVNQNVSARCLTTAAIGLAWQRTNSARHPTHHHQVTAQRNVLQTDALQNIAAQTGQLGEISKQCYFCGLAFSLKEEIPGIEAIWCSMVLICISYLTTGAKHKYIRPRV